MSPTDGDAFTAASLNGAFADLKADVDEAPGSAIEPSSLSWLHLPPLVGEDELGAGSAPGIAVSGGLNGEHDYTAVYDTFAPVTDGVTPALVTFAPLDLDANTRGITALLVLCNVEVVRAHEDNAGAGEPEKFAAALRIAYRDGLSNWKGIARTERFVSGDADPSATGNASYDKVYKDAAIREIIDVDVTGSDSVSGVRLEAAFADRLSGAIATFETSLFRYNLTVLPLFGEKS